DGKCPDGFNMNGDGNCFPNKPCPSGYENHDYDETGKCWKVESPTPDTTPPVTPISQPDDGCLFDPSLPKCAPIDGKCPDGFNMNGDGNCFPNKPCPSGYENHDYDETGKCWKVESPTPDTTPSISIATNPTACTGAYHYEGKSKTCVLNSNCKENTSPSTSSTNTVYCTVTDVKTKKVYINKYPVYRQNTYITGTQSNVNTITIKNFFTDNVYHRQAG